MTKKDIVKFEKNPNNPDLKIKKKTQEIQKQTEINQNENNWDLKKIQRLGVGGGLGGMVSR